MLAADILEVPVSWCNNRYLLVVMDYFTKCVEAIPLQDQTAASISAAVIKLCCSFLAFLMFYTQIREEILKVSYFVMY